MLQQLVEGYLQLLDWSEQSAHPLLAHWHLQQLGPQGLRQWIANRANAGDRFQAPVPHPKPISPLVSAAMLGLIEAEPLLLEAYLNLELRAELLGREPDLDYRQRLVKCTNHGDGLLLELFHALGAPSELERRDDALKTAQEEVELILLQLHQTQRELDALVIADYEKQQLLDAGIEELKRRDSELKTAQDEAELTLLHLHQVQEELEHYFLISRSQTSLLNQYGHQQRRAQKLLAALVSQQVSP
jgi:hypothetical protein